MYFGPQTPVRGDKKELRFPQKGCEARASLVALWGLGSGRATSQPSTERACITVLQWNLMSLLIRDQDMLVPLHECCASPFCANITTSLVCGFYFPCCSWVDAACSVTQSAGGGTCACGRKAAAAVLKSRRRAAQQHSIDAMGCRP